MHALEIISRYATQPSSSTKRSCQCQPERHGTLALRRHSIFVEDLEGQGQAGRVTILATRHGLIVGAIVADDWLDAFRGGTSNGLRLRRASGADDDALVDEVVGGVVVAMIGCWCA